MKIGANYNVVKDKSMDEPILRLVDAGLPEPEYIETPNTVRLVLRDNTAQGL